jgi:hypothetical protein
MSGAFSHASKVEGRWTLPSRSFNLKMLNVESFKQENRNTFRYLK